MSVPLYHIVFSGLFLISASATNGGTPVVPAALATSFGIGSNGTSKEKRHDTAVAHNLFSVPFPVARFPPDVVGETPARRRPDRRSRILPPERIVPVIPPLLLAVPGASETPGDGLFFGGGRWRPSLPKR